ncbi:MAG: hypothetical protein OEZ39_17960 [Gammaproteobacteria bacterium]|nr:hypothetical protein [Gammaproteobacteria bacterium]MDH5653752.1 hypothetical protein [Gammaproteobacteria bacterium]
MPKNCAFCTAVFLSFILSPSLSANDDQKQWYDDAYVVLGINWHNTELHASDALNGDRKLGIMADEGAVSFLANISTRGYFLNPTSNFGYQFSFNIDSFNINHQLLNDGQFVNLNTSVKGEYIYITPVLFYNFGDKQITDGQGEYFRIGLGFGAGYLKASGSMYMTERNAATPTKIDINETTQSISFLLEYRYADYIARFTAGGPKTRPRLIELTFPEFALAEYTAFDIALSLGYVIQF